MADVAGAEGGAEGAGDERIFDTDASTLDTDKADVTCRGFDILTFTDRYGEKCRLQKSSLATQPCIWFGVTTTSITVRRADEIGWRTLTTEQLKQALDADSVNLPISMHLTQEHVKKLLPVLTRFAETGELHSVSQPQ